MVLKKNSLSCHGNPSNGSQNGKYLTLETINYQLRYHGTIAILNIHLTVNFVCWADSMLSEKTDLMRRNGLKRRMTIWLWSNWTRIAARLHLTTLEVEGAEAFDEVHAGLYGVASASGF